MLKQPYFRSHEFTVTLCKRFTMFFSSANEDFKVDERVINIVRDAEDKSNADDSAPRPKSSSFMARSGSFTTKGKDKNNVKSNEEKEKDNSKDEKIYQQFNKNVSSLLIYFLF